MLHINSRDISSHIFFLSIFPWPKFEFTGGEDLIVFNVLFSANDEFFTRKGTPAQVYMLAPFWRRYW